MGTVYFITQLIKSFHSSLFSKLVCVVIHSCVTLSVQYVCFRKPSLHSGHTFPLYVCSIILCDWCVTCDRIGNDNTNEKHENYTHMSCINSVPKENNSHSFFLNPCQICLKPSWQVQSDRFTCRGSTNKSLIHFSWRTGLRTGPSGSLPWGLGPSKLNATSPNMVTASKGKLCNRSLATP